jgi:molybdate transport system substrate-binding protein
MSERRPSLLAVTVVPVLAIGALLAGCAGGDAPTRTITVSAASSLAGAFEQMAADFTAAHPGARIDLNINSSSMLARQIVEGAPADVYATADDATMDTLAERGLLRTDPTAIATNALVVVVKPGNPEAVIGLADLARLETVALCSPEAPCGRLADGILTAAGVNLSPDRITRAANARATLAAVVDGDADGAIVYVTDARTAGDAVDAILIPDDQNATNTCSLAVLAETDDADLATSFAEWVAGPQGRRVLESLGFSVP